MANLVDYSAFSLPIQTIMADMIEAADKRDCVSQSWLRTKHEILGGFCMSRQEIQVLKDLDLIELVFEAGPVVRIKALPLADQSIPLEDAEPHGHPVVFRVRDRVAEG